MAVNYKELTMLGVPVPWAIHKNKRKYFLISPSLLSTFFSLSLVFSVTTRSCGSHDRSSRDEDKTAMTPLSQHSCDWIQPSWLPPDRGYDGRVTEEADVLQHWRHRHICNATPMMSPTLPRHGWELPKTCSSTLRSIWFGWSWADEARSGVQMRGRRQRWTRGETNRGLARRDEREGGGGMLGWAGLFVC